MKRYKVFILISLAYSLSSCIENPEIFSSCAKLGEVHILTEEEVSNKCSYNEVYLYQDTYYTICFCCFCLKQLPPIDCDGNLLCENVDTSQIQDCRAQFDLEAEYLFSVTD